MLDKSKLLQIGEFSKACQFSIKTLHHYHEKGLLVPSYVDHDSNYRLYSEQDLIKAQRIQLLKSMSFNLNEIKLLVDTVEDEDEFQQFIIEKLKEIDKKAREIAQVKQRLQSFQNAPARKKDRETFIRVVPKHITASIQWQGAYPDSGIAFQRLYKKHFFNSKGSAYNLYPDGEYRELANIESCLPLKKAIKSDDLIICERPEQKEFVMVHVGPFEKLPEAYFDFFCILKENNIPLQFPLREVFLKGPGMLFKGDPDRYITEICCKL